MNFHDREPQLVKKDSSKLRDHFRRGLTAFLVIVAGVLFFFAFLRIEDIAAAVSKVLSVLSPIITGFIIAFLLNPIVKLVERFLLPILRKTIKKEGQAEHIGRASGIFVALVLGIALVAALLNMLIPELYKSIRDLVVTLPEDLHILGDKINTMLEGNSTMDRIMRTAFSEVSNAVEKWVEEDLVRWAQTDLLAHTGSFLSGITAGVISVVNVITNLLVGIIVSVYMLFSKEKFLNQSKKVVYALCSPKRANLILHISRKANEMFSGFIIGKIIDSAIIGVLCFIGLTIFRMPYALLVSVIVGVTNIVPFFGPYIGAIPSAILILLVDPMKGLGFIIFIILLQQLDGNVIGPKILGDSTGLSSFWVIFSILVSGGLFGLPGMIIGVPTFALIYYIIKMFIQQKLEQKDLPTETKYYNEKNYVDDNGEFVIDNKEEETDADSSTE